MNTYFIKNVKTSKRTVVFGLTFEDAMRRANLYILEWICYAEANED